MRSSPLLARSSAPLWGLALLTVPLAASAGAEGERLPHAIQLWDNAARLALPLWLKAWLGFLAAAFLASLFFVRQHAAARWAAGGFAMSHLLLVGVALGDLATIRTGLVSLSHTLCWSPALVALARELPSTQADTRYGLWCRVLLGVIAVALIFDVRDSVMYLYYAATGHPVFSS